MKGRWLKIAALAVSVILLYEVTFPVAAYALTSGPSQPEFSSFEPVSTSEMVDVGTGDFNYNIPILDVEGYPVNISYHSGTTMDQEASWVGLGWNINPGVINRNMRGLPDDFSGDMVEKEFYMKPNRTWGVSVGGSHELFGFENLGINLSASLGMFSNNYRGLGLEASITPSISVGEKNKPWLNLGLGMSVNSQTGLGFSPNLSYSYNTTLNDEKSITGNASVSLGLSYTSRGGLQKLSYGTGLSVTATYSTKPDDFIGPLAPGDYASYTAGTNGGSSISFAATTYVPQITMPMENSNYSLRVTGGLEIWGLHPNLFASAYFSEQALRHTHEKRKAYGYLYAEKGAKNNDALMDLNREKDGGYAKGKPNLPLTNFSYDIYSVAGQGISGMYRPYRDEVGTVFDAYSSNEGGSTGAGLELGGGTGVHFGANVSIVNSHSYSGAWRKGGNNAAEEYLKFSSHLGYQPTRETFCFKQAGEKTISDGWFLNQVKDYDAVRLALEGNSSEPTLAKRFVGRDGGTRDINGAIIHGERIKRNQTISFLNKQEADSAGLHKKLRSYKPGSFPVDAVNPANAYNEFARSIGQQQHIGEITALRPDGTRYVYGIPVYNLTQKEATFNASEQTTVNYNNGTVTYIPGTHDQVETNPSSVDNFYSATKMPAYAYSYLLTDVLSADYVDVLDDGITPDDLGTAVKFNYTQYYGGAASERNLAYRWRAPYGGNATSGAGVANYDEGFKSNKYDDKGSYVYGTKEVWYMHSIESKNYIAKFYTSKRKDGLGVNGNYGKRNDSLYLQKLDSIVLYAKHDVLTNGANAFPIKTIHFEYDYSLCPNVENNDGLAVDVLGGAPGSSGLADVNANKGKLTLKKVYFTYGHSRRGKLSPYVFSYDNLHNYAYAFRGHDRWGNYAPNDPALPLHDYPYVNQANADAYAKAWSLNRIDLPSGGIINIEYEADDYAFVQDRRAMQMFKLTGTGKRANAQVNGSGKLYDGENDNYNYLFFDLSGPVNTLSEFRQKYIGDMTHIYYKCLLQINQRDKASERDYVPGMAEIADAGVAGSAPYTKGWIKLKEASMDDNGNSGDRIQPIAKSAWQYAKVNLPGKVYPGSDPKGNDESGWEVLGGMFGEFGKFFSGFYETMLDEGYAERLVPQRSWIRLYEPSGYKKGGGSRVKKLTLTDNWSALGNGTDAEYGQIYDYTNVETINGVERTVSSGVAAYEPALGNDENPFFEIAVWKEEVVWAADNFNQIFKPIGESFFPAPTVGYSKVKVSSLNYMDVESPGYTISKFYTAKDFPVRVVETDLQAKPYTPDLLDVLVSIFVTNTKDYMTASQGYAIELNDMHGKPRGVEVYSHEGRQLMSSTEIIYQTDPNDAKRLYNKVDVINNVGKVENVTVGVEVDVVADARENYSYTFSSNTGANLDVLTFGIFPVPIPTGWPTFSSDETRFRSSVVTKVINRYGILQKTINYDQGSRVETENLAYDRETGEVLLTKVNNAYEDPVYNFTYPAHWAYDGMGPAYKNINAEWLSVNILNGIVTSNDNKPVTDILVAGDEVLVYNDNMMHKYWVGGGGCAVKLIDIHGDPAFPDSPAEGLKMKIIRSGRRNMQALPVGTVVCLEDPLQNGRLVFNKVLNAAAAEYHDGWATFACGIEQQADTICGDKIGDIVNPYVKGLRDLWRQKKGWVYYDDRTQGSGSTNIRQDGVYATFAPFWKRSGASPFLQFSQDPHWTWTSIVSKYSPYGYEIENMDALNVFSSALYGYNNSFPVAVAANARYREILYDGFEDYGVEKKLNSGRNICLKIPHWGLWNKLNSNIAIVNDEAHTGIYSLKIAANTAVTISSGLRLHDSIENRNTRSYPEYTLHPSEVMPCFAPDTLKQHWMSLWVKKDAQNCDINDLTDIKVIVKVPGTALADTLRPVGHLIEGWQKIEGKISILEQAGAANMEITLQAPPSAAIYVDDLRFLPFKASMRSFVYDQVTLRVMAELDDNNYATFYEYDEEGKLIRLKKETAKGIVTLKESRMNTHRP